MSTEQLSEEEILQAIREHRSSESNFAALSQQLDKAIGQAQSSSNTMLLNDLQEVKEKYLTEYEKAKETGGSAWPEFENFVTQFERSLTTSMKEKK